MFTGNTETGITATYQDGDGTIDLAVGSITSAMITDGTIATADLADNSITAAKIPNATALTLDGGLTVDNITIDGTEIDLSSGNLTIDVAGSITLDSDTGVLDFSDGGTNIGRIENNSAHRKYKV